MAGDYVLYDVIRDKDGNGINGASVEVRKLSDNSLIASTTTATINGVSGAFRFDETQIGFPGPYYYSVTDPLTNLVRKHTSLSTGQIGAWRGDALPAALAALGDGVVDNIGSELAVSANGSTMVLTIADGRALCKGLLYRWPASRSLTVTTAHATLNRIDTVVLRFYPQGVTEQGRIDLLLIAGTPASSPVAPTLTQNLATYWDFPLADVRVDAAVSSIAVGKVTDRRVFANRLDYLGAPNSAVSFNGQKITNLAAPTADTDAANKAYVDALVQGLDIHPSVRVASVANVTVSNPGTAVFDGVTLTAGDRILLKNQTAPAENGIYVFTNSATALVRGVDADTSAEVTSGMFVFVEEGTTNADQGFALVTNNPIVLGTTALSFTQITGAGQITAGTGLTKTGNTLAIDPTATLTLTNKTLTSPVINNPTINNPIIDGTIDDINTGKIDISSDSTTALRVRNAAGTVTGLTVNGTTGDVSIGGFFDISKYVYVADFGDSSSQTFSTSYAVAGTASFTLPSGTWTIKVRVEANVVNSVPDNVQVRITNDGVSTTPESRGATVSEWRTIITSSQRTEVAGGAKTVTLDVKGSSGTTTVHSWSISVFAIRTA